MSDVATPSFRHAAHRHIRDAQQLRNSGNIANADHLGGFAAECAIKGLVADHLGGRVDGGFAFTPTDQKLKQHIGPALWGIVATLATGRVEPEIIALFEEPTPFADWAVSDRYAEGSHISATAADDHIAVARRAIIALEAANLSMNGEPR